MVSSPLDGAAGIQILVQPNGNGSLLGVFFIACVLLRIFIYKNIVNG